MMTIERQDILEDFYAGNTKDIEFVVYTDSTKAALDDITDSEVTYVIFDERDPYQIRVTKSSIDGGITLDDPSNGHAIISLVPVDTAFINGTFRHQCNVVKPNGDESTAFTGKIQIFKSFARRPRQSSTPACAVA